MHALRIAIAITWAAFWIYWLGSAFTAKKSIAGGRRMPLRAATAVAVLVLVRAFRSGSLAIHSPVLGAIGAVVFASGLLLALWARVHLGRNWGMPMTQRAEPELVTSGPYRFVRHPIYSGLLLGLVGTALATDLLGLIIAVILGAYFYYSASVEEKNLVATFPTAYPAYRTATKMLIPFVL
ncbi:MAG TPA: isoprenylcysteine carboxylmethyltransferase family protein [Solirubrobacteraceae bacterium]|nr:isoprenylcysteine carboxylmethyltransferase family protein [Solirubrobacteraceae bacterium]